MEADEAVETAVARGDADGAELLPVYPSAHLAVDVAVEFFRFAREEVDIVRCQHTVDDCFIYPFEGDEAVGEHPLYTQAVVEAATVDSGGDAVRAYSIYIQAGGNGFKASGGEHGLGGEEVVLGAEYAVGKAQVTVYQELTAVGALPDADEVDVGGVQTMAAEISPALAAFRFADGRVVGVFTGSFVQFFSVESDDILSGEFGGQCGECAPGEEVVTVHKEDVFAFGFFDSSVTSGTHALVLLVDNLHLGVLLQQRCGIVGAAIIDNNSLEVGVFL